MPSRQLSEGRNQHSLLVFVVGETRKSQAISTLAQGCRWMNMAANIEQVCRSWAVFRLVAQPETAQTEGRFSRKHRHSKIPVVIASNQENLSFKPFRQRGQVAHQSGGEPLATVDQIAQDDDPLGAAAGADLLKTPQCSAIFITRHGYPKGLKHLGLAKVEISDQKVSACLSPDPSIWQKHQLLIPPTPDAAARRNR